MATCAQCGSTFDESTGACPACTPGTAPSPAAPPPKKGGSKTLVVVLLAVLGVLLLFCLAIIAAVAIPNFLSAKSRAQQKRAVSDVRSLATAVQSFQVDYNCVPDSHGNVVPASELEHLADEYTQAQHGVASDFVKFYAGSAALAQADGTPYYYAGNGEHFLIIALGSDGQCDPGLDQVIGAWLGPWPEGEPPVDTLNTPCYESDILWGDYEWLWVPQDRQKSCGDLGGTPPPPRIAQWDDGGAGVTEGS